MAGKRLLELDALRGLAAIAVLIYHYFLRYHQIYGHAGVSVDWSAYGKLGVNFFFMVSGFVIFMTLENTKSSLDFIISRISRLYPAYWFAVIFTFTAVSVYGLPGREVPIWVALVNLSMLQGFLGTQHVDGVYWTLTVEITFYFWIFVMYLLRNLERTDLLFGFFTVLAILHNLSPISIPAALQKILFLDEVSFFLMGICLYRIIKRKHVSRSLLLLLPALAATIPSSGNLSKTLLFVFFCIFFYAAVTGKLRFLGNKPLVFLGSISYSLYLLHQNLGYLIIRWFYSWGYHPFLGVLTATLTSMILATIIFTLIEQPVGLAIKNSYRSGTLRALFDRTNLLRMK